MDSDFTKRYKCKYTLLERFGGWLHLYEVVTRWGGVHLHITEYGEDMAARIKERYSGGIEYHWIEPPEGRKNDAPDHLACEVVKRPCWHDGSSLYASEHLIPQWENNPHDHEMMFRTLARLADEVLKPEEPEAVDPA